MEIVFDELRQGPMNHVVDVSVGESLGLGLNLP